MDLDEYTTARLVEAMERAVVRMQSPWMNRQDAAEYARCSTSEVDRAADAGAFTRYKRAGTPMFKKVEIDLAIAMGKWPGRKAESGKQKAEMEQAA